MKININTKKESFAKVGDVLICEYGEYILTRYSSNDFPLLLISLEDFTVANAFCDNYDFKIGTYLGVRTGELKEIVRSDELELSIV